MTIIDDYNLQTPFNRLRGFREAMDDLGFHPDNADEINGGDVVNFLTAWRERIVDLETTLLNIERADPPRVVVVIAGGNLSGIYASDKRTQADLIDHDNMEADGLDGDECDDAESKAIDGLFPLVV